MRTTGSRWYSRPLPKLVLFIAVITAVSSAGFYFIELRPEGERDFFSAVWWAVVTLTTVGYGDLVPSTTLGRALGLLVMVSGIGLVSALTGTLASFLVERQAKRRKGLLQVHLSGHILILGWNSFGLTLVESLRQTGALDQHPLVIVAELDEQIREELGLTLDLGERLRFVTGNPAREGLLQKAAPSRAGVAYVLTSDGLSPSEADQRAILTALTFRSLAPKVKMYGQISLPDNRRHMLRAGADEAVVQGELAGLAMGLMGANQGYWQLLQALMGITGPSRLGFRFLEQEEKSLTWREFLDQVRGRDQSLPLALCRMGKSVSLKEVLDEGSAIDRFIVELFEASGSKDQLGRTRPTLKVNPADSDSLADYDSVVFLGGGESA